MVHANDAQSWREGYEAELAAEDEAATWPAADPEVRTLREVHDEADAAPDLQTLTFEHTRHGRYEVPADYFDQVNQGMPFETPDQLRELAEDMTDGDTDLADVTSPVALAVILASLRYERELGSYVPTDKVYVSEFGPQT